MYIHDSHIHTHYSFDTINEKSQIEDIVKSAIEKGIDEISLCDHCDIDDILDGLYPPYPADIIEEEVCSIKEKYKGKITINFGIELGQPHTRQIEARNILESHKFDFIIGSIHNLRNYPDFSLLKLNSMSQMHIEYITKRYLDELNELLDFKGINTLAHTTYVLRYLRRCSVDYNIKKHYDEYEKLYKKLVAKGIALEVNTSGLIKENYTMPDRELCYMYKECGGELITLGSDAHMAEDVGSGIEQAIKMLKDLGFKSQLSCKSGKISEIEL